VALTPSTEELVQHLVIVFWTVQILHEFSEVEVGHQDVFRVPGHIDYLWRTYGGDIVALSCSRMTKSAL
jgi:hypothetical protein